MLGRSSAVILATRAITYVIVFESQWDMTLGKMAMKIEVSDDPSQRRVSARSSSTLPQARCSNRVAAELCAQDVRQYHQ